MKIVMKVNLGSRDAARYGLKYQQCTEGSVLTVAEDVGKDMTARRFAAAVEATPKELKAVPEKPSIAAESQEESPKGKSK